MNQEQFFTDFFKEFCLSFGMEYSFSILMKVIKKNIPANYIACTHYNKLNKTSTSIFEFSDPYILLPHTAQGDDWITVLEKYCLDLNNDVKSYIVPDVHNDKDFLSFFTHEDPINRSLIITELYSNNDSIYFIGLRSLLPNAFNIEHACMFAYLKNPIMDIIKSLFLTNPAMSKNTLNNISMAETSLTMLKHCPALSMVIKQIEEVAPMNANVLILGETGVGKEVVAEALHENSKRNGRSFVKVNCASIPESLLEAQLFGYEKGAFTGAIRAHKGYFEQANGGTLYLDEIGELSLSAQVKLLRVIESREVQRIGSQQRYLLDFRLICATNKNLLEMVENNTFRADLWYRINVYPIHIPALRHRKEDISILLHYYCKRCVMEMNMTYQPEIRPELIHKLILYPWKGNVRELRNWVEQALIHTLSVKSLTLLPPRESTNLYYAKKTKYPNSVVNTNKSLTLEEMTKEYITWAIQECHGRLQGPKSASELLNIKATTLRSRMQKLNIPFPKQIEKENSH